MTCSQKDYGENYKPHLLEQYKSHNYSVSYEVYYYVSCTAPISEHFDRNIVKVKLLQTIRDYRCTTHSTILQITINYKSPLLVLVLNPLFRTISL